MEAILYIGISQTLVAGFLMVFKQPRMRANIILASWLFLICIEMIIVLVDQTLVELYPLKILPYTYGPLLLLYTKWITAKQPEFQLRYLWHFAPFLVFVATSLVFINERVMEGTHGFFVVDRFISLRIVYAITFFISITAYSVATFVEIHHHRKRLKELVSFSSGKLTLQWLLGLSITFYSGYVLMFIFGGVDILTGFMPFDPYEISFIGLTILTFLFTIFGFSQPRIFGEMVRDKEVPKPEKPAGQPLYLETKKYARSGLKEEDAIHYVNMLDRHMEENKPYLDRELTIYDLSEQLDIPRHSLSEVINEYLGKNFYTLVNGYRVEEFKRRIRDPEYRQLTILAIAYDAGFNSKSSFNTIFKEVTGMTPSEYLKSVQDRDS